MRLGCLAVYAEPEIAQKIVEDTRRESEDAGESTMTQSTKFRTRTITAAALASTLFVGLAVRSCVEVYEVVP